MSRWFLKLSLLISFGTSKRVSWRFTRTPGAISGEMAVCYLGFLLVVTLLFEDFAVNGMFVEEEPLMRSVNLGLVNVFGGRFRRSFNNLDCSKAAEKDANLKMAISAMIRGQNGKGYLLQATTSFPAVDPTAEDDCIPEDTPTDFSPDLPIRDRALCGFAQIENVDEKRLPQTIPEVRCSCSRPANRQLLERFPGIHCAAIYYDVPILRFKSSCSDYEQTSESIALGCVPVLSSQSELKVNIERKDEEKADLPTK
ncbi:hypothetical protein M3Y96_00555000 [Aphelenchoides besseyi]|nr:hypothetical protein M3Y96_00555000 [Aphelenchoides besseyi]